MNSPLNVAILGASNVDSRYSNMAQRNLLQAGYKVIPVNPKYSEVMDVPTVASLSDINEPVDTLTIYLDPSKLVQLVNEIIELHPRRAIFNPGTEAKHIESALQEAGIKTEQACTLVLLRTGQFED
jgi:uncharacterized protein